MVTKLLLHTPSPLTSLPLSVVYFAVMSSSQSSEQEEKGVKVTIRDLEDVLIRDVGNKIAEDGRWPLLIDETGQVSVFVRYTDTNYLNAANPANMEPEKIR